MDLKQLHKIVNTVNKLRAELIVLAGDTFDQDAFFHCDLESVKKELRSLCPKGKIYAVLGNHDPASDCMAVRDFFKEAGIHLLIDEWVEIADFLMIGRDDIPGNPNRGKLSELTEAMNLQNPKIILDHNSVGINDAVEEDEALILCGHTHRGQFFPATLFTKMAYGKREFYGYSKTAGTQSVVFAGVDYFQIPMRLGTSSEIVVLDIVFQKEKLVW